MGQKRAPLGLNQGDMGKKKSLGKIEFFFLVASSVEVMCVFITVRWISFPSNILKLFSPLEFEM